MRSILVATLPVKGCVSLVRLFLLVIGLIASAAHARPPAGTCFAVAASSDAPGPPAAVRCNGEPSGYQGRDLWLRLPIPQDVAKAGGALVVHTTRFQRLDVHFIHPDGSPDVHGVRRGAFGDHWHIAGQLAFGSRRGAPVSAVWMRIGQLESYDLLRVRFLPAAAAARQFELCALAIGAALALLAIAASYNLGLAIVLRRRFFIWHACWAASVLFWGIVWSQAALAVAPAIAGTLASRLATILACLSIMFAALSSTASLRLALPRPALRTIGGIGVTVAVLGLLASLPGADLSLFGELLGAATMLTLAAVATAIGVAWRRGHPQARDLAIAWALPMAVLGATQLIDFSTSLWGGGAQIAVLFASAFQTICLSSLATARLSALRVERDAALADGSRLAELADRDPLTGLLNRRGFVARSRQTFGDNKGSPFGLLLIDVDRFKSINDRFGHEAGDAVLVRMGAALRAVERKYLCLAGRLGGEEFVVGVSGMPVYGLHQLAETVRETLANCDCSDVAPHLTVTVSIGVAEGVADGPFRTLYGKADRALYAAKQSGRNKVVFASEQGEGSDAQLALSLDADDD